LLDESQELLTEGRGALVQELKINHHLTERRALLDQSAISQVPMNLLYQKALSMNLWNAGVDELREYWSGKAEVFTSLRNRASRVISIL
jgi:hypothetical protein